MSTTPKSKASPAARPRNSAPASTDKPLFTQPKPRVEARIVDLTNEPTESRAQSQKLPEGTPVRSPMSPRSSVSTVKASTEGRKSVAGSPALAARIEGIKRNIMDLSQLPAKRHRPTTSFTPIPAQETFPFYSKGTVSIITSTANAKYQYRLHKAVLERNSTLLRDCLSQADDFQIKVEKNARFGSSGSGVRYTFLLVANPSGQWNLVRRSPVNDDLSGVMHLSIDPPGNVVSATPSTGVADSKPQVKGEEERQSGVVPQNSSGPTIQTLEAYNSLLLAFYNSSPNISSDDIYQALSQCEELLSVASDLGSLSVVRPHVNSALSQYRHKLFAAISVDPPRWLKLAIGLESALIFTESMIHIVGCWPSWPWSTSEESLDVDTKDPIARKARSLADLRSEADHELFLNTIKIGDGPDERPVDLKSRFETWMVIQVFRDWLANSMADLNDDDGSIDTTNIGLLYRTMLRGGDAYLPLTEIHSLLREHGTGRRGLVSTYDCSDWEEAADDLKLLKDYAAETVKDVCKNNLMLDAEAAHLSYLTAVDITPEDFPWTKRFGLGEEWDG